MCRYVDIVVPVVVLGEDPRPPARQQGEEPGRQVPGGVDGVSAVVAEAETDTQHCQTHPHRHQLLVQLRIHHQYYRFNKIRRMPLLGASSCWKCNLFHLNSH